jgi:hypothetical protein
MMQKGEVRNVKLRSGSYKYPVRLECTGTRIEVGFSYNPGLLAEIKSMQGAKWHGFETPPKKVWTVTNNFRNWFQFRYMMGEDVYAWFDRPLNQIEYERPLKDHQAKMANNGLTYHYHIFAADMGTGKTLAAIEVMERSGHKDWWFVGPKVIKRSIPRELRKWNCKVTPRLITYEELVKMVSDWKPGDPAPHGIIFDESSKIKTSTAKRSQAAMHVAEAMRQEYGIENSYILLMTGTPAPKHPTDWWGQCETACPGFVKEGDVAKFKNRLCLIENRESLAGGMYPHLITWLDDENKCAVCGQYQDHPNHCAIDTGVKERIKTQGFSFGGKVATPAPVVAESSAGPHAYTKSKNEVANLFKRLKGLVTVVRKEDLEGMPPKLYEEITVPPTVEMLRASKIIKAKSRRAIEALTLLRELSDGFQYQEVEDGEQDCPRCNGTGEETVPIPLEPQGADTTVVPEFKMEKVICQACDGRGYVPKTKREAKFVSTPKDEALIELLDQYEDTGRAIVWGGFQATIDRLVEVVTKQGWTVLRIDGRGQAIIDPNGVNIEVDEAINAMDLSYKDYKALREKIPLLCVVGNPKAGGMSYTFTASRMEVFYSNTFDGEARFQSEDRIHRLGVTTACMIYDIICLPSDKLVLNNLKLKRKLQDLTLGDLECDVPAQRS